MTNRGSGTRKLTRRERLDRERRARRRRRRMVNVAAIASVVALGVGAAVLATGDRSGPGVALTRTGAVNEMGMPVIETPGRASGVSSAAGVEVRGADWAMGQVPLEVAVLPSWTLVNASGRIVTLGEPHPEVRAGCCPGPFTFGTRVLGPGESTTMTFELSMHPGMNGWHDIAVHVPVRPEGGPEELLELVVTGDFRGTFQG